MQLDLGYVNIQLHSGWIARIDVEDGESFVSLIHDQTVARLNMVSAGDDSEGNFISQIYDEISQKLQLLGTHFDDLAEEFDNEMIVEIPSDQLNFDVQHYFLRQIENLVVMVVLRNYEVHHEDEIRAMLDTLAVGAVKNTKPAFERISFELNLESWDQLGETVFTKVGLS